ncbi:MAG: hypothetical protein ACI9Y1_001645 [Lentisphaeria bacterium]|jgi:hypothetical protein
METTKDSGSLWRTISIVLLVVIVALVLFYLNTPRFYPLDPPVAGGIDYNLVVNEQGVPQPYTKDGEAWAECSPEECGIDEKMSRDVDALFNEEMGGYVVLSESRKMSPVQKTSSITSLLGAPAHAASGSCYIICVYIPQVGWRYFYDRNDPNCP